ncbi:MAG: aldo/keto reductase [Eubacteriales bacterium]|nr:aldo/keto reductase [Eubacteriales bacterium]
MKKFGFGCMRMAMTDGEVDTQKFQPLVDRFLAEGFTYFDTAHGYLSGKSETALRECLVKRYPRESYVLTDKLTDGFFQKKEDLPALFADQLEKTGVSYFDYYLMHALTEEHYQKFERCEAFAFARQLKQEGKIRHLGISFHDRADVLEKILTEHPEIEVVQIQFNYADYDDPTIQSKKVYDVCVRFGKPVIVMEPCKGGGLIDLPDEARAVLEPLGGSPASYAIRFAASFPQVMMVLSGMSDMQQLEDNLGFMKDFRPLSEKEQEAITKVQAILREQHAIACTACRYCTDGCPQRISIPDLFACLNQKNRYKDWNSDFYYMVSTAGKGKASDCIGCGRCERVCPQHLPIRQLLKDVAAALERA